jgi:hypothetical protein
MKAIVNGIAATILTFVLWFGLIVLIGFVTDSGPGGICGPTGSFGGILFYMVLLSPMIALFVGFFVTINSVGKKSDSGKDVEADAEKQPK